MMSRDNKRRSVSGSVKSGRSSISTLTQLDFSCSSGISAITMDDDLGSNFDRSSFSYRNFGPKLRSMPEQQRASDPDMEEVQDYLDTLRLASGNSSNQRFSNCDDHGDALCDIPRRKSSSSNLDYRTAHSQSVGSYFLRRDSLDENENKQRSSNPLHGDIDSIDSFCNGLEEDDEVLPLSFTPRSSQRSSQRSSGVMRGLAHYGAMMSSISLDIGDLFDDEEQEIKRASIFDRGNCSTSVDVSPQVARRRSSLSTFVSSNDLHARIPTMNLMEDSRSDLIGDSMLVPQDSGEICLAGDDRFKTRCPKEKSNSIAQPTRRVSAYTFDLKAVQLTTCTQG